VTSEKFIENNFWLKERNMSDLHSIVCNLNRSKIKIRFSDEYDIVIRSSEYSEAELAAFIQVILDHSDVEAELDSAVQELLRKNQVAAEL
jgi:molybdate-binding protein